jgi:hypothetical protein
MLWQLVAKRLRVVAVGFSPRTAERDAPKPQRGDTGVALYFATSWLEST